MKQMMGGTYWENVRRTFLPEFISMNAMMAAMAPTMSFLMMGRDMRAMDPFELIFWGVMSLGVIVGFAFAYPFNVWMVSVKLKHGLMTVREARFGKAQPGNTTWATGEEAATFSHSDLPPAWAPTRPQQAALSVARLSFFSPD